MEEYMNIKFDRNDKELTVRLEGILDTSSAPVLEDMLGTALDGVELLIFDLEKLECVTSAGLRVIFTASQIMADKGDMILRNLSFAVRKVFDVTGFSDELKIE